MVQVVIQSVLQSSINQAIIFLTCDEKLTESQFSLTKRTEQKEIKKLK